MGAPASTSFGPGASDTIIRGLGHGPVGFTDSFSVELLAGDGEVTADTGVGIEELLRRGFVDVEGERAVHEDEPGVERIGGGHRAFLVKGISKKPRHLRNFQWIVFAL
jgi:hypothetical protein